MMSATNQPVYASAQQDEREALSEEARKAIEGIARHPYQGKFSVFLSGADARALLAQQVQADVGAVAYRVDWPAEFSVGMPRFFGADDAERMKRNIGDTKATIVPLYLRPVAEGDAGAVLVSRADLEAINTAMQHLGDVLNGMDAVEAEDEEKTEPGFEAISRILASDHSRPAAESDKRDANDIRMVLESVDYWVLNQQVYVDHRSDLDEALKRLRAAMSREQGEDK